MKSTRPVIVEMRKRGFSQVAIARQLKVTESWVSVVLKGSNAPRSHNRAIVMAYFDHPDLDLSGLSHITGLPFEEVRATLADRGLPLRNH